MNPVGVTQNTALFYLRIFLYKKTQPNSMREMLLEIFVLLFVVALILYPFKIKAVMHVNVFEDLAFLAVKVFDFKLFCARFTITKEGKLDIDKFKKKKKKKKDPLLLYSYFTCLAKLLNIKKFELYFTSGFKNNAYHSAMLCGYVNVFSSIVCGLLLNKYKHIKIYSDIGADFENNRLELSGMVVVCFSLLDMLISVICAYKCYFQKKLKERRRKQNG